MLDRRWPFALALSALACAPHGEAPPAQVAATDPTPDVDEPLAISIAQATLDDCIDHSFTAELKRWDAEDWWNVSCRRRTTPTSIEYASTWIRKSDGRQHYGAHWVASTQPEWVTELLRYPGAVAVQEAKRRIGPDRNLDCPFADPLLHRFSFFCIDRDTAEMWDVSIDTRTGTLEVGPSAFQELMAEMGRDVEASIGTAPAEPPP